MEKLCISCGERKTFHDFYESPQTKDGRAVYCKECHKAKVKEARERRIAATTPILPPPDSTKTCSHCKEVLPIIAFGRNRTTKDGLQSACRPCTRDMVTASRRRDPAGHRASSKRWREANLSRHADNNLRRNYGVEHGTYDKMLVEQDGKCAICGTTKPGRRLKRFHMDHCHETGAVRGLLCTNCNTGLGQLKHDVNLIQSAIKYLSAEG